MNTSERLCLHFRKVYLKNFLHFYNSDQLYSYHRLAKGTFDEIKMVTSSVKECSNQSRLNQNVSYHKILDEERKDIRDA